MPLECQTPNPQSVRNSPSPSPHWQTKQIIRLECFLSNPQSIRKPPSSQPNQTSPLDFRFLNPKSIPKPCLPLLNHQNKRATTPEFHMLNRRSTRKPSSLHCNQLNEQVKTLAIMLREVRGIFSRKSYLHCRSSLQTLVQTALLVECHGAALMTLIQTLQD